jgi:mannose-6-phosphate isomerase-like protein (cupin superfamily)
MPPYRVDFGSLEWRHPDEGVRSKVYKQDGRQIRLLEFTSEFVEAVWCTRGHIGYILEGRLEIDFSGEIMEFGPGNGIFIPAGHKHKARVLSDVVRLVMVEDV